MCVCMYVCTLCVCTWCMCVCVFLCVCVCVREGERERERERERSECVGVVSQVVNIVQSAQSRGGMLTCVTSFPFGGCMSDQR